jgi:hypothetical protein
MCRRETEWVREENSGCGKKTVGEGRKQWVWEENIMGEGRRQSGCGKKTEWVREEDSGCRRKTI